jgi:hypothetical protein
VLARARTALANDRLAHRLEERPHLLDGVLVAADHDREGGVAGADIAPGDGRVDRGDALRPGRVVDLDRQRGLARRHIHDRRAVACALENAVRPEDHRADIVRVADDREHDLGGGRNAGRRVSPGCSTLEQALGLLPRPVVDGRRVAGLE